VIDKILNEGLGIPVVGDADFLWFLSNSCEKEALIEYASKLKSKIILTPNVVEFKRLYGEEFDVQAQNKLENEFLNNHLGEIV